MGLETRVALIGVVGALAGTLAGGLVTWQITHEQISSQRADAHRTERLNAYATYFGDANRLWSQVFIAYEVTPAPRRLTASQTADLKDLEETLIRDYALVALVAPPNVRDVARRLSDASTDAWNALHTSPIDRRLYLQARHAAAE